ncbi:hypothetical protein [Baekduia alba]|uniref:hypothetical protein n=1 Tax=Baekduia alba TaxID=2997333 RepID=UPI0023413334|nr:hypothetical protein [Baekduia alba]
MLLVSQALHQARPRAGRDLLAVELLGRDEQRLDLVALQERTARPHGLEPPSPTARRLAGEDVVVDRHVEDRRQQAKRLVNGLVPERPAPSARLVARRRTGLDHVLDALPFGDLVPAVLVDELHVDRRNPMLCEERQQMARQPPGVVGIGAVGKLASPAREVRRRELVERLLPRRPTFFFLDRRRPDACADACQDVLELAVARRRTAPKRPETPESTLPSGVP